MVWGRLLLCFFCTGSQELALCLKGGMMLGFGAGLLHRLMFGSSIGAKPYWVSALLSHLGYIPIVPVYSSTLYSSILVIQQYTGSTLQRSLTLYYYQNPHPARSCRTIARFETAQFAELAPIFLAAGTKAAHPHRIKPSQH